MAGRRKNRNPRGEAIAKIILKFFSDFVYLLNLFLKYFEIKSLTEQFL